MWYLTNVRITVSYARRRLQVIMREELKVDEWTVEGHAAGDRLRIRHFNPLKAVKAQL